MNPAVNLLPDDHQANPVVEYFDDFAAGQVFDLGSFRLSEQEIMDFANRYDPQPFHTDPSAAEESIFGGLIASGWQTISCFMRLMVDNMIPAGSSLGSPGIEELRWLQPVRPGVDYRAIFTVVGVRASQSKPDRGVVSAHSALYDPDGQKVMTFNGMGMYLKRPVADD